MAKSWRSILERAAENLSIDLDQMASPAFSHAQPASFGSRRLSPQLSFAESRELLARELQAFSSQSRREQPAEPRVQPVTALTVPVTTPKVQPVRTVSRKRTPWQNLFATLLSAVITGGLTAYFLLAQGDFGKEGALSSAAYASVAGAESQPAASPVSANSAAVVSRPTEGTHGARLLSIESWRWRGRPRGVPGSRRPWKPARGFRTRPDVRSREAGATCRMGIEADIRVARAWYKKASELGSLPAYERLKELDKRS